MDNWLHELGLSSFVALDLETTGLDASSERVIEIGAVRFIDGSAVETFQSFISSDKRLSAFITDLTGITEEDLQNSPKFETIADSFLEFVGNDPIIAQNADFDLGFLFEEGNRLKDKSQRSKFSFRDKRVLDTAMLARIFWPELTGFSLSSLTNVFSVPLLKAHRASHDAEATGNLLIKMIEKLSQRCWREFTDDLLNLIGTTTHRSKYFFVKLAELNRDVSQNSQVFEPQNGSNANTNITSLSLEELYGQNGLFETRLRNFQYRSIQLTMAESVENSIKENNVLLLEAPTGTGKSLAYLIPAIRWVLEDATQARQVYISSSTKTLQDQLYHKDICEVESVTGNSFQATVLKGRNNYLCRRRFKSLLEEADSRLSEIDRVRLMPLIRWAKLTQTGDISEIGAFNPNSQHFLWSQICSDSFACSNTLCSSQKGDFHKIAQERADKSNIVFVNHALLLSDFARFSNKSSPNRKFVLDEAHHIERSMVGAMSEELSYFSLRILLNRVAEEKNNRGLLFRLSKSKHVYQTELISARINDIFSSVKSLHLLLKNSFSALGESLLIANAQNTYAAKLRYHFSDEIHNKITKHLENVILLWRELESKVKNLLSTLSNLDTESKPPNDLLYEVMSLSENLTHVCELIESLVGRDQENSVKWVEASKTSQGVQCKLQIAPVSIADNMVGGFWNNLDAAVLTSATLTTSRNFDHLKRTLGLDRQDRLKISEVSLPSVFPLKQQMKICVPKFLENPKVGKVLYDQGVIELCCKIVQSIKKGTLILCTSLEFTDKLTGALSPILVKSNRQLYSQAKGGNPAELLKSFKKQTDAVLIGAQSFWEGIDIVGDSLQLLVVTKLPFDVPTDPWFEAKCEMLQQSGFSPFNDFSLPESILKLKQGVGRLIRHQSDVGVAVIIDPRVVSSSYAGYIRKSLPVNIDAFDDSVSLIKEINNFFPSHDKGN